MTTHILLLSDIHGNYPALQALTKKMGPSSFQLIINCGDSLVYAPFPNKTMEWLRQHRVISILGNTDKKVLKLLRGKTFKKPGKPDKRVMYTFTAEHLSKKNRKYLRNLEISRILTISPPTDKPGQKTYTIGIFHGSPADPDEFLFDYTPDSRFLQLAQESPCDIIVTGHSHTPYCKTISDTTFINPGSVGRMFDQDPRASCATLEISDNTVKVVHHRIRYKIKKTTAKILEYNLPPIYNEMYKKGVKLN